MALTHMIEASPIADRYARGWHCLGLAADYRTARRTPSMHSVAVWSPIAARMDRFMFSTVIARTWVPI